MEMDLAELGIPGDRSVYLPNAVDVELFRPQGEKEDNLILFIGRITFNKGLHVLLESLRYLTKSAHLVIIGPMDCSFTHRQRILKLIERENQKGKHKITYLGGLPHEEVIEWYQKASIFVLPSFMEAFPVVLLEALSCETPVIATPVGGVTEIVNNFENGILVPINDSQKLAEAIQHLLDNKEVRIRLGREGRKWVTRKFSLEAFSKKLCDIYEKVISCN
jgi:glycosyltransferase involved in cell wall biosynthesis